MVLAGDPILASDLVTPTYKIKSGAETVNNSATLQDDNDLFVDLAVGTWRVELIAHYTVANTTADFRCGWSTTGTITALGRTCFGGGDSISSITDSTMRSQGIVLSSEFAVGGSTSPSNIVREDLLLDVSVAGRLQFRWAQGTANASDTIVTAASRLIITELTAN